jgi:hypothetical protein
VAIRGSHFSPPVNSGMPAWWRASSREYASIMKLRTGVGVLAILAIAAGCKKSSDGGSGSAGPGSAVATGAGGSAGGSASAAGSGATAGGSGATAGSAAAGSGASAAGAAGGAGSATGGGSGAAGKYDKAAFLADPLCIQVADKIRACAGKPEFATVLDEGATARQKKINARLRRGVKKWQASSELCHNAWDLINYEYTGFLDKPSVFKAPDALSSCIQIAAAVKAGGGLVGGKTGE